MINESFVLAPRKKPFVTTAKAEAKVYREFWARQDLLRLECGTRRCELCERVAPLVTWDEREHGLHQHERCSRQPIWRICVSCNKRALMGRQG